MMLLGLQRVSLLAFVGACYGTALVEIELQAQQSLVGIVVLMLKYGI